MAAVSDTPAGQASGPGLNEVAIPPVDDEASPGEEEAAPLDALPLELLMELASWLDWRSLLSLERVSVRCRDAVSLHLGRLRTFRVSRAHLDGAAPTGDELAALLPRLTALRELAVLMEGGWVAPLELLRALAAGSRRWSRLERLTLDCRTAGLEPALLRQLCANCARLTDVSLRGEVGDPAVLAVLAARPSLRALRVTGPGETWRTRGGFLPHLPAGLRRLVLDCHGLLSTSLPHLARCGELRSLELLNAHMMIVNHVRAGLSGCVRLERLTLTRRLREASVSGCLPLERLSCLRHLDLSGCHLPDAELRPILERLPGLESVRLARCTGPSPAALSLLGRLPALRSLDLVGAEGVSDWSLASLTAAPLVDLHLGDGGVAFSGSVTPEGLFALHQGCPTLRRLTLWADSELVEYVDCGPGVDERRLLRWLRARLRKMVDLAMFARVAPGW